LKIQYEADYYDILLDWLEEKGYYTGGESYYNGKENWYKNIGPSKKCRLDIIGVKNIGPGKKTLADDIELIGIEVKHNSLTYKDLSQAAGYKIFVHKAYLATDVDIAPVDEHWARILGVGLISLGKRSRGKVMPVIELDAIYQIPNLCENLRLLRRMSIGRCTICQTYFMLWEKVRDSLFHTYISLPRIKQINHIAERDEDEDWQYLIENPQEVPDDEKIQRFLCRSCANLFSLEIKGEFQLDDDE